MKKTLAFIGNQNSGKTTLFNALTGLSGEIGNFPGVTVEKITGSYSFFNDDYECVDLPGVYSLSSFTLEERVTLSYLFHHHIDMIINVVDLTRLDRSLYLTLQLLEFQRPMLVVFTMYDEFKKNHGFFDKKKFEDLLLLPTYCMDPRQENNIQNLKQKIKNQINKKPYSPEVFKGNLLKTIERMAECIPASPLYPSRLYAICHIEKSYTCSFSNSENEKIKILKSLLEQKEKEEATSLLIMQRYAFIDQIYFQCIKQTLSQQEILSEKIDSLLTHKYLGIPLFLLIMLFSFYCIFFLLGIPLSHLMNNILQNLFGIFHYFYSFIPSSIWLKSLLKEGIEVGLTAVLSFLPIISLLFFFLSFLQQSGYLARIAFLMDTPLKKIGLPGKSIVPLLLGFGCSVPAIMATRTLSNEMDRKKTLFLIPFISCSAKLPVYSFISFTLFKEKAFFVIFFLYVFLFFIGIIYMLLLKRFVFNKKESTLLLELPTYRLPRLNNMLKSVKEKVCDFLYKAFTIIFIGTILIWFLQNFDISFHMTKQIDCSLLAIISKWCLPFFKPIGICDWHLVSALFAGVSAKESIVSTLSQLLQGKSLLSLFVNSSPLSFLVFVSLYTPCIATLSMIKKEMNSSLFVLEICIMQMSIAYILSFFVYKISFLF